ncbi:MAG: hypothetical protein Q4C25_04570 [Bacillota bacterium]|nr:hypothetical protein [Bacillota bacterium]
MAEEKKKRSIEEIIYDATEKQLDRYPEKTITVEELEAMVAARTAARRKNVLKVAGFAALFVVAVVGAVMVFSTLVMDVGANKNAEEEIVTEDGVVIEDEGWGSSDEDVIVAYDWREVYLAKEDTPEVLIPQYVSINYELEKMTIEDLNEDCFMSVFCFKDGKNERIEIHQYFERYNTDSLVIEDAQKMVKSTKGDIYIRHNLDNKNAVIQMENGAIIEIWAPTTIDDKELIKIIENLK